MCFDAEQEVAAQKVGRPKIGGPFKLTNQYGNEFTHEDLLGKHSLIYVSQHSRYSRDRRC